MDENNVLMEMMEWRRDGYEIDRMRESERYRGRARKCVR